MKTIRTWRKGLVEVEAQVAECDCCNGYYQVTVSHDAIFGEDKDDPAQAAIAAAEAFLASLDVLVEEVLDRG